MNHSDVRQASSLAPLAIGAVSLAACFVGTHYFRKVYKRKSCNSSGHVVERASGSNHLTGEDTSKLKMVYSYALPDWYEPITKDEKNSNEQRTIKIEYRDKEHIDRAQEHILMLSPKIIQAFALLQNKAADEKVKFGAICDDIFNANPALTLTLIKRLFDEAQTDDVNPVLIKDTREYNFFIELTSTCGASDEVKKKIALKYVVPQIEHLLQYSKNTDTNYTGKQIRKCTIAMIEYLPDADRAKLQDRLYGLRFKTKEFKRLTERITMLCETRRKFIQSYSDTIYNDRDDDCNGQNIDHHWNAVYTLDGSRVSDMLPIFTAHSCVKAWYQSFEYQLYAKLCSLKPNMISCFKYTQLKRWNARSFARTEKDSNGRDINIFKCQNCKQESKLPCNSVDPQSIIACKVCMAQELKGRTVDLTDCYHLDRVSLHRLIHRAYRYKGFFNRIKEEDSEAYEDIPHGNRLQLPLLKLLINYYGINYIEGDGAHGCDAHLQLGLQPVLLDAADIEILPTFRTGDSHQYNRIECIVRYDNDINELLATTRKTLPNVPEVVTIIYKGKQEQYHLYENKIALDLINVRSKLAHYFFLKDNWPGSNQVKAKELAASDESLNQCIQELKAVAKLYGIDYKKLKHYWAEWWYHYKGELSGRHGFNHDARVVVTLPIKHTPIALQ